MNVVIVGVDFSEISARALEAAQQLSTSLGARLHLVHVVEPIEDDDEDIAEFHQQLENRASRQLQQAAEPLGATFQVELGKRAETLLRLVEENEALLVMGRPAHEAQAGTCQRALSLAQRPVVLVP